VVLFVKNAEAQERYVAQHLLARNVEITGPVEQAISAQHQPIPLPHQKKILHIFAT
jgi:hypothetical protein